MTGGDLSFVVILNYGSERVQEPDAIGRMQQCHYSTVILGRNQNIQDLIFSMTIPALRRAQDERVLAN